MIIDFSSSKMAITLGVGGGGGGLYVYVYDLGVWKIGWGESEGVYIKVYRCLHVESERTYMGHSPENWTKEGAFPDEIKMKHETF